MAEQQIIKLLNEIKTKIDEEDEHEEVRFAKLNKHFDEIAEKEAKAMVELEEHEKKRMQELEEHMEEMHKSDCIRIKTLPKALHIPLGAFDSNDDGEIDMAELQHGAELYKAAKDKSKLMTKVAAAMFLLVVILVGVLTGIMISVVEGAKEAHTADSGLSTPAGAPEGVKAVSTGAATEQSTMSSSNTDAYFASMSEIALSGFGGKSLSLKITGFYRQPCMKCASGQVVTLVTDGGMVDIVNSQTHFFPNDAMVEVDPSLADWTTWRSGPDALPDVSTVGRPTSDADRRKLLSASSTATATLLSAADMEPMSATQIADGFDTVTYSKVPDQVDFDDNIKDINGSRGFSLIGSGIEMTVPDHMTFKMWQGKNNQLAFTISPNENNGVFGLPGFYWTGGASGHLVCGDGMSVKVDSDGKDQMSGNLDFMGPNSEHMDQTEALWSKKFGVQVAFMHVFDLGDISAELDAIATAYPDITAQVYYEVLFNIEDRNSADFIDTSASVRYTMVMSQAGFTMETNLFNADVNFDEGTMAMSMFGQSLTLPSGKRHLLAASNFHDELAAKLGDMFAAAGNLGTVDSAISSADSAETKALETRYINFAKRVIQHGGELTVIEGTGSAEMQEYMSQSSAMKYKFMMAIGIGSNYFGTPAETPFDPPQERRSVIEAAAAASASAKNAKKTKSKKAEKKKKKKKKKL